MALLLAMYQKLRLTREKNQAVLDLAKFSSKIGRVEKNITNTQKRYTSLIAQVDAQAKQMASSGKNWFNNYFQVGTGHTAYGLSAGNFLNGSYNSGLNQMALQYAMEMAKKGYTIPEGQEGAGQSVTLTPEEFMKYQQVYYSNMGKLTNADGTYIDGTDQTHAALFMQAMQAANQFQGWQTMQAQQCSANYESNVSVWAEARKAELEEEQDAALEPLHYQQTMWELEKTQLEQKIERIKAELESYNSLVSEETKNAAPKFGL